MTTVKEKAYAKINLFLDVVEKREDGFHNVKTVMHSVDLFDMISVSVLPSKMLSVSLKVKNCPYIPSDGRNLASIAAREFCENLGITASVYIEIDKRIPVSAGLAGGSTDAAAVLRALNRIYKRPLTFKALAALGARIGSDVPYCVVGKTALCEGRGEIITPLCSDIELHTVIVSSSERVSTPEAYKALDNEYSDFDGSIPTGGAEKLAVITDCIKSGELSDKGMFNIFEQSVLRTAPKAKGAKQRLLELGSSFSMMSGSGPSVFGVFPDKETAASALDALKNEGYRAFYAKSVC